MTDAKFPESAPQVLQLLQRFIRLRKYFRIDSPQNMRILAEKLRESKRKHPTDNPISPDVFYNLGMILSRDDEPKTMSELSRDMEIPMSSATRIIDWMTKNGYTARFPDPEDRRIVRVGLTDEGRSAYASLNDIILESFQRILKIYTPEEIKTLQSLFCKALDEVEKVSSESSENR